MKFIGILSAIVIASFAASSGVCAQGRLIAIIAGATTDPRIPPEGFVSIKDGAAKNIANMTVLLNQIGDPRVANIPVMKIYLTGNDFTCAKINAAIHGLDPTKNPKKPSAFSVSADDTILFYYASHGYRKNSASTGDRFPRLWCSELENDGRSDGHDDLGLSDVAIQISALRPRLVIALADACNTIPGQTGSGPEKGIAVPTARALTHVFMEYRGMIVASASLPGKAAWYLVPARGGVFTNALLKSINLGAPSWAVIESEVTRPVRVLLDTQHHIDTQTPQFVDTSVEINH